MSGVMLKTKATVGADKTVTTEGNLFDAQGKQIGQFTGSLAPLDDTACKNEFSKVPPMK